MQITKILFSFKSFDWKLILSKTLILSLILSLFSCSQTDPAIAEIEMFISKNNVDTSKEGWQINGVPKPPMLSFDSNARYLWKLTTNLGEISLQLKPKESPYHVSSTIYLTTLGFYDGIIFHRVIPGFMAQGGDPLGEGIGGPGYTYSGEFESHLSHDKPGILSMANAGASTDGSQFFITFKATPHLDGRHTIFGEVISGFETLKAIEALGSRRGKTKSPVTILSAKILVE